MPNITRLIINTSLGWNKILEVYQEQITMFKIVLQ